MANRLDGSVNISRASFQIDFNQWVGLPYGNLGRGPDAYDCWGLIVAVYNDAGLKLPSFAEQYVTAEDQKAIAALIAGRLEPWHQIRETDVRPLDCVLLSVAGYERHIGVVVKRGYMLHVGFGGDCSQIERYNAWHLKKRISRFMRHEALT